MDSEPTPSHWLPPTAPTLTPTERDAAIQSGGLQGLVNSMRDKAGIPTLPHIADVEHGVSTVLDQYREGHGGTDLAEIHALLGRHILAGDIFNNALRYVASWIIENPGRVVPGGEHSTGKKRIF